MTSHLHFKKNPLSLTADRKKNLGSNEVISFTDFTHWLIYSFSLSKFSTKGISFFAILLICFAQGKSQSIINPLESLREERSIVYGIDNRRTIFSNNRSLIYGLYLGVGFGNKLKFKLGISGTPFESTNRGMRNGVIERNQFVFLSVGEELTLISYKNLHVNTYAQIGYGINFFRLNGGPSSAFLGQPSGRHFIFPLELGLHPSYKIRTWLFLRLGGGYRHVFSKAKNDLNGYYLKAGIGVDLQKLKERIRNFSQRQE